MITVNEEEFKKVCADSRSMLEAAGLLGIHFNTFKRYALKFGCYEPNPGRKNIPRGHKSTRFNTEDIIAGNHPGYHTFKLKRRLFEEGMKNEQCELCGITDWNNQRMPFELNHIDGNHNNHSLENLQVLCPNCHSQTPTWRSRNRK